MNLRNADETTISALLDHDQDWAELIFDLEEFASHRGHFSGMEVHHIEPERERTVSLWELEHLAIHICHAKLDPTDSNHAKVGAFVKVFPGAFRRQVHLSDSLQVRVVSFGQTRPSKTVEEMTRIANLPQAKAAQQRVGAKTGAANARKGAEKTRGKPRSVPITWGDKISDSMCSLPQCSCIVCHSEMRYHQGNIKQHSNSPKCIPYGEVVMQCVFCQHPFISNNLGTLTRHINSSNCKGLNL
jgi:hypothetical protein